jgi:hypothetical protein
LVCEAKELSVKISSEINKKLEIAKMIYEQQLK